MFVLVSEENSNFRLPDFCFFFLFVKKGVPLAPTCKKICGLGGARNQGHIGKNSLRVYKQERDSVGVF